MERTNEMKRNTLSILAVALLAAVFVGCSDDELTPKVDTANEYEARLLQRSTETPADSTVYSWYQKYGSAFIYDFTDAEFHWQWASQITDDYVAFDMTDDEDKVKYQDFVKKIDEGFMQCFSDERLKTTLPYRIFLCKRLNPTASSISDKDTIATTNSQDAIIVAYEGVSGQAYSASDIGNSMTKAFALFFYSKLTVAPTEFIESRTECKYSLVTTPADDKVSAEFTTTKHISSDSSTPAYKNHEANVCGYIRGYLFTYVKQPTEEQDFADYFAFLACNSSAYIRKYCQTYWRIAKRATIFMNYWKENMGEDLMETHNQKYPNDPLTARDFKY
jgi:hypothetical protein